MKTFTSPNRDTNRRIPAELISHGVWLSDRFCLSDRDVEELLCVRDFSPDLESLTHLLAIRWGIEPVAARSDV
jgi:hypothetical protein